MKEDYIKKIIDFFETTSIDYNKDSEETYTFFKTIQNKLHYAITNHTVVELNERIGINKVHMGFKN